MSSEPVTAELQVRFFETDQMGGAYHTHYLVWFEVGRTEYLRSIGRSYRELERQGIIIPVLEVYCRYRRPARYDDRLRVEACCERAGRARVRFLYRILREDGELLADGWTIHGVTDAEGVPRRLPAGLVRRLFPGESAEGTS